MKIAALDLGTNTFLMLIAEVLAGQPPKVLEDHITVTRLGQNVHLTGEFHSEALERAEECFSNYSQILSRLKVDKVIAVATAAARDVKNSQRLFEIGKKYGIPIQIISGDREAELTFKGSTFDQAASTESSSAVAVIDVGGGSTEVILGLEGKFSRGESLPLGSVRLTEKFITGHPVSPAELLSMKVHIQDVFNSSSMADVRVKDIVAVAGTPTTLTCLEKQMNFEEGAIHGHQLPLVVVNDWVEKMSKLTVEERVALPGMEPKRADVIVAGASILHELGSLLGASAFKVSTKGVRYGVAIEWESFE